MRRYYFLKGILPIVVVILSATFICCKRTAKELGTNRKIDLNPTTSKQIKLSQIFSTADIFSLNSNDIVYERAKKMIVKNNLFFMQSKNMIIVCNLNGDMVLHLSRRGNAPGEYLGIADFDVEDNGNIIINDTEGRKMERYSSQGEYINTIKHRLVSYNFIKVSDKIYLNSCKFVNPLSEYEVNVWNEAKNSIEERYLKQEKALQYLGVLEYTNFSFFDDTISYSQAFSSTIYHLASNQAIPRFDIDFGKYKLPKDYTKKFTNLGSLINDFRQSGYASRIDGYREGSNFLFFSYAYLNKRPFFWLSKMNNNTYHFDEFEDDFLFPGVIQKTGYELLPILIDENYVYTSIDAHRFIELYDNIKKTNDESWENQAIMEKIYSQINEDSNNLIVRYTIKKR